MKLLNINQNFKDLNLNKKYWEEYQHYKKKSNIYSLRVKPYINRVFKYITLFGINGLFSILKISSEKLVYKIFIK